MKVWRSRERYLVQRDSSYWLVDSSGSIAKRYEPSTWSIEDELGHVTYAIEDGKLREYTQVQRWHGENTTASDQLDDLVEANDAETLTFIATVLGDDSVKREEERLREIAAADARVDAIDGARSDLRLGDVVARAQAGLVERIYRWGDTTAAALLRTLITLARAQVDARAIHAYAIGCLHACFEFRVPTIDEPPNAEPVASPFADQLGERARELDSEADGQEWVDATANAAAYRRAARAVRVAQRWL